MAVLGSHDAGAAIAEEAHTSSMDDAHGMIVVRRPLAEWRDLRRAYRIKIDGELVGTLRVGQQLSIEVPFGTHRVQASIDGLRSNGVDVDISGSWGVRLDVAPGWPTRPGGYIALSSAHPMTGEEQREAQDIAATQPDSTGVARNTPGTNPYRPRPWVAPAVAVFWFAALIGNLFNTAATGAWRWSLSIASAIFLGLALLRLQAQLRKSGRMWDG